MKTAVSIPDDLFRQVEAAARRLKTTRSGVIACAAREFLERHAPAVDATEAWNRAIAAGGQPGDDPAARSFRRRTKAVVARPGRW